MICGDGCLMEGVSHEAIDLAGHLKLTKLIVMWDDNRITIDGATSLATSENQRARFEAAGWHTIGIDGHDQNAVETALKEAKQRPADDDRLPNHDRLRLPQQTGHGKAHGSAAGRRRNRVTRVNWDGPIPRSKSPRMPGAWRAAGARSRGIREAWEARFEAHAKRDAFIKANASEIPADFEPDGRLQGGLVATSPRSRPANPRKWRWA